MSNSTFLVATLSRFSPRKELEITEFHGLADKTKQYNNTINRGCHIVTSFIMRSSIALEKVT